MGRNKKCFCGSELKTKKCHPDINEKSKAARLLKTYNKIDIRLGEYYREGVRQPPCKPGCYDCCYDYFTVSDVEYDLIIREIQNWDEEDKEELIFKSVKYADLYKSKYPSIFEYFDTDHTGIEDILLELKNIPRDAKIPCVFLDEKDKICKIYKSRPMICRIHGVSHYINQGDNYICEKIGLESEAKSWLVDFTFLNEHQYRFDGMYFEELKTTFKIKGYPLFYLLYYNLHVKKNQFKIVMYEENFKTPEHILVEQYKKFILSRR